MLDKFFKWIQDGIDVFDLLLLIVAAIILIPLFVVMFPVIFICSLVGHVFKWILKKLRLWNDGQGGIYEVVRD